MIVSRLANAAGAYACAGWRVFPLVEADKVPALPRAHPAGDPCRGGCGKQGHGYLDATADADHVGGWWRRYPQANIGLPCAPNGIAVVDVDPRHGGDVTLSRLELDVGELPATLSAFTGGDGLHLLYRHPGVALPGSLGPGIDVKANGYIVVPPSIHPDTGHRYVWTGSLRRPAPWPRALTPRPRTRLPTQARPGVRSIRAFQGLVATVLSAREGQRNTRLFWAACKAFEHRAHGAVDPAAAARVLLEAALRIGLPEDEARRTITSAYRAQHLEHV